MKSEHISANRFHREPGGPDRTATGQKQRNKQISSLHGQTRSILICRYEACKREFNALWTNRPMLDCTRSRTSCKSVLDISEQNELIITIWKSPNTPISDLWDAERLKMQNKESSKTQTTCNMTVPSVFNKNAFLHLGVSWYEKYPSEIPGCD